MSTTFAGPVTSGRHRLGRPGLIPVTTMIKIGRRGFFARLFRPGLHRWFAEPRLTGPAPAPVPAV